MLVKLIIKNVRSAGPKMLQVLIAYVIIGGLFIRQFYTWELYMMYGYMTISWIASAFCFTEKKNTAEIFSLSLPVSRSKVVISRYLTSVSIIILGFFIWYLGAYVWDLIFQDDVNLFNKIMYIKVGFMATLFLTVQQSLFLPFSFKLNVIGMGITFVVATALPITMIATVFAPYKASYNPIFIQGDLPLVIFFLIIIVTLPVLSIALSHRLYDKNDL